VNLQTATVPGQRLGKHVPVARQQIINNAIVERNNRRAVFSMWSVPRCYTQGTKLVGRQFVWKAVKRRLKRVKLKNLHC
jgi:hypothetical protein